MHVHVRRIRKLVEVGKVLCGHVSVYSPLSEVINGRSVLKVVQRVRARKGNRTHALTEPGVCVIGVIFGRGRESTCGFSDRRIAFAD